MERKQGMAYPLLGYRLMKNPQQPTLAILGLQTEGGDSLFAVTKEILEELAEAFQRQAADLPAKSDLT